eukprot:534959-Pyramimonas_sp.AAC.1
MDSSFRRVQIPEAQDPCQAPLPGMRCVRRRKGPTWARPSMAVWPPLPFLSPSQRTSRDQRSRAK